RLQRPHVARAAAAVGPAPHRDPVPIGPDVADQRVGASLRPAIDQDADIDVTADRVVFDTRSLRPQHELADRRREVADRVTRAGCPFLCKSHEALQFYSVTGERISANA